MRIPIRDLLDPGSGMKQFESGIRDKHPKSAHTATVSHQWCDLFYSTTAQLYATHRRDRRKRHLTKRIGMRPW